MTRRRAAPWRSSVVRSWFLVRRGATCFTTGHTIAVGERALFRKVGHERSILCEVCARQLGFAPPEPEPFVPGQYDPRDDPRARQLGEED